MVAASAPMIMILSWIFIGISASIPFIFGLLGLSRRAAYIWTAILAFGLICLELATFDDSRKYQNISSIISVDLEGIFNIVIITIPISILARWAGAQLRNSLIWLIKKII